MNSKPQHKVMPTSCITPPYNLPLEHCLTVWVEKGVAVLNLKLTPLL